MDGVVACWLNVGHLPSVPPSVVYDSLIHLCVAVGYGHLASCPKNRPNRAIKVG